MPIRCGLFRAIERRFIRQACAAVLVVGATGFYKAGRVEIWDRFWSADYWWLHAMVGVWLLFAIILFVAEPVILHRRFDSRATTRSRVAFAWLNRAHWVLLVLSLLTIFGAVAGSQGWSVL